ncbi:hypothetical protein OIU84_029098, partial [Salix udensis]
MRETSWVSRTTVRDEMGFRREMRWVPRAEMGYRREMRWVPREARDDTEGQRRRGTEEARDDGRSQARGEGNDERVDALMESNGGSSSESGFVGDRCVADLPSLVFGMCYSDSQTVLGFKSECRRQSMSMHRAGNMQ